MRTITMANENIINERFKRLKQKEKKNQIVKNAEKRSRKYRIHTHTFTKRGNMMRRPQIP